MSGVLNIIQADGILLSFFHIYGKVGIAHAMTIASLEQSVAIEDEPDDIVVQHVQMQLAILLGGKDAFEPG